MRSLLTATCMMLFLHAGAQQNPALASFMAVPGRSDVLIQWTVEAGYSCTTTRLEWSIDSITFSEIYTYPGICGSTSSRMTYSYTHSTPSRSLKNFYRLDLGNYGHSEIVGVNVTSNYTNYRMYPVPFKERTLLTFENPENRIVTLYLFDRNGQMIRISDRFIGNTFTLERNGLSEGFYYFVVTDGGNFFVYGKTAVSDL